MKNYALFSKNGRFIGFTNFKPENGLYKEMPDDLNPVYQVYVGDYETGSLKNVNEVEITDFREANIDKKWTIFESQLNDELSRHITENLDMPLYKQINAIMETLYINKDKIQLSENFEVIYDTIQKARHNHLNSLKTYEEAPKAQVIKKDEEKLYIEEYTTKQLNIQDEPVTVELIKE
jgi:hypothetical protein